ncbi:MAG: hypothetical protein EZS28_009300 [Streblomastix strix]|uniref:Uncharacterized protein n=1 Tax=Streblomastix strix TaxID=222440 RepID=A0A5J4WJB3_9EUKA|nr:MAG: hypothetical protein EZS28_009300 [Streblomastix strix]
MFQGKEMLITYKTTGSSMGNDSYYSDNGYNGYQTTDYRSGSSYQQITNVVEDKDKKDKQDMKKKENIDKDSKKEKVE